MANNNYMAFVASTALADDIRRFVDQVSSARERVDHALVNRIADRFIEEMLYAFFSGPVDALEAEGRMVSLINGISNVVSKAAKGLTKRLLKKIDSDEQAGFAQHFDAMSFEREDGLHLGFLVEDTLAERMLATFESVLDQQADPGEVSPKELEALMHRITDGAIACFLDGSVAQLKLGRITRGLVSTARITIRKASYSASGHLLSLPLEQRKLVVSYFKAMLMTHDA